MQQANGDAPACRKFGQNWLRGPCPCWSKGLVVVVQTNDNFVDCYAHSGFLRNVVQQHTSHDWAAHFTQRLAWDFATRQGASLRYCRRQRSVRLRTFVEIARVDVRERWACKEACLCRRNLQMGVTGLLIGSPALYKMIMEYTVHNGRVIFLVSLVDFSEQLNSVL